MEIVVCIKQVPDTTVDIKIDPETNLLDRKGVSSIINPFDMYALEEALRLKEKHGGHVTVITMGPPEAQDALREAISFGADNVILLTDSKLAGSDTLATSYALSVAIKKLDKFDIILCGNRTSDGGTAQVGPGIAGNLEIPQVAFVRGIESVDVEKKQVIVQRMIEDGYQRIQTVLPALLTVVKEINEPRLPSLRGKMKAVKFEIPQWDCAEVGLDSTKIGLKASPAQVVKIDTPPEPERGEMFEGELEEAVQKVGKILQSYI